MLLVKDWLLLVLLMMLLLLHHWVLDDDGRRCWRVGYVRHDYLRLPPRGLSLLTPATICF